MATALALGLNEEEKALFSEIYKVMEKYKHLDRKFGLSLVHSHFPMSDGEVLYETHDVEARTLKLEVIDKNKASQSKNTIISQWQFDGDGNPVPTMYCCTLE
ncbi:hypothetical protein CS060_13935 [Anoxybacillus flavithermus]|uniref:Uncharacterized protein n=1 Tax=Anoxybacillus flavithermus TaxID=33934 RepID=A0A2G5RLG2_9BACL|nr:MULTISPECIES: hypothetical protein [Anoxybacillus]PIC03678.1 hypothetical protein CS060_13935 [Anoxybacillus flavithermus]